MIRKNLTKQTGKFKNCSHVRIMVHNCHTQHSKEGGSDNLPS